MTSITSTVQAFCSFRCVIEQWALTVIKLLRFFCINILLLRPTVQWHIKNSKNHLVSSSPPLGRRWLLLHPWPNGGLKKSNNFFCCFGCVIEEWALTVIQLLFFCINFCCFSNRFHFFVPQWFIRSASKRW